MKNNYKMLATTQSNIRQLIYLLANTRMAV